jgi:hypothetical protein
MVPRGVHQREVLEIMDECESCRFELQEPLLISWKLMEICLLLAEAEPSSHIRKEKKAVLMQQGTRMNLTWYLNLRSHLYPLLLDLLENNRNFGVCSVRNRSQMQ